MRYTRLLPLTAALLAGCADGATTPRPLETGHALAKRGAQAATFPSVVALPTGFSPEGIAFGRGSSFYVGSIPSGAVYRGDAATGLGSVLVPGRPASPEADPQDPEDPAHGRQASGLKLDGRNRIFVAGGLTGQAYVYDASTGADLAVYRLTGRGQGLVNDVVVTRDAAYFTDSFRPVLYRVPLARDGALPPTDAVEVLELTGDFVSVPGELNGNGIAATPDGGVLLLANSATGTIFRVDPETGRATAVDLGGYALYGADGIVLDGRTLYVVQGGLNRIAVARLSPELSKGTLEDPITSDDFDFPSTTAGLGGSLYTVNARFHLAPPPMPAPHVEFQVVRTPKR